MPTASTLTRVRYLRMLTEVPRFHRRARRLSRASGNRTLYALTHIYLTQVAVLWFVSLPIQVGAWPGILTAASPITMSYLLARGTGKPLLEKGISARRPGYDDYARRTSGFIPLPPKGR